jgi:DNA-binding transcriptional LysR family regulator
MVDLTQREADLALRTTRPQSGDLVTLKLGEGPWTPMVSTAHAKKLGKIKNWAELDWIAWGDELAGIPPERWLARHAARAPIALRTNHIATHVTAVEAGLGAALLPPAYLRVAAIAPVRCARTLAPTIRELPANETWLVGHRTLRGVPRIAAVWSFLVEEFTELALAAMRPRLRPRRSALPGDPR